MSFSSDKYNIDILTNLGRIYISKHFRNIKIKN